jgi:hypothetical protein
MNFTRVHGAALDADGERVAPGTRIEAFAGEAQCGYGVIPPVAMQYGAPDEYTVLVAGPDARA